MTERVAILSCKQVVELVTEYLSGALPPVERARLEQHVFACPPCMSFLEQIKTVVGLAAELENSASAESSASEAKAVEVFRRWKRP